MAEALLAVCLPPGDRDEVLGDLAENHGYRVSRGRGRLAPALWYWWQVVAIPARLWWRLRVLALVEWQEVRQTLRGLAQSPGFTAVAVLSLGLGIGANTAIFSTIRSVLYTALPVDRPEELSFVYHTRPRETRGRNFSSTTSEDPSTGQPVHSNYSYPSYQALREAVGGRLELAGFNFVRRVSIVVGDLPAVAAGGLLASGDYFSTLRLGTVLGRSLSEADDRPDAPRVAVISYAFWQRAFGGDPSILERSATINGVPFRIVGVTPPSFGGVSVGGFFPPTDVTAPFSTQPVFVRGWTPDDGSLFAAETYHWVRIIARAAPETRLEPLHDAMTAALRESMVSGGVISAESAAEVEVRFLPGGRGLNSLRRQTEQPLRFLAVVVGVVLLIACANLASLMLARGAQRQHELAVRRALGASRLRLMRQLLLESSLLALLGGAAGLMLALWSGPLIAAAMTAGVGPVALRFELDWVLLAVTAAVALAAATLSGFLPALKLTSIDPYGHLRTRGGGEGRSRARLGRALIAVQIAVSIPLIVAAGLFLRTLANLRAIDPGFDPGGLVVFGLDPSSSLREPGRSAGIYREVLENLESIPGVESATLVENALVTGWISNTRVTVDEKEAQMYMNAVGPRFFETVRIPLVVGRPVGALDDESAPRVVVVNETAAQRYFGGNAVGRSFLVDDEPAQVVGVAADSIYESLRAEVQPTFYDSYLQRNRSRGPGSMHVVLRASVPPASLERAIRDAVARAERQLPVIELRTQSEQIEAAVGRERISARLLATFGGFALLLACVGLYGVTSFSVARRTGEMGIRLALGARRPQVLWMVLRQVLALAAVGSAMGLVAAYFVGPVVASMLYGLEPSDPLTSFAAAGIMLAVAAVAGWFPARRASRTDALITLAQD